MKEKREHPLPPPDIKMAYQLSLRGLFAKDAPDQMPDWYKLRVVNPRNNIISEEIYFGWKLYYADRMIELLNKK